MAFCRCFNKRIFNWKIAVSFMCLVTIYFYLYQNVNSVFGHPHLFRSLIHVMNKNSPFDPHVLSKVLKSNGDNNTLLRYLVTPSSISNHTLSNNVTSISTRLKYQAPNESTNEAKVRPGMIDDDKSNLSSSKENTTEDPVNHMLEQLIDIKNISSLEEYRTLLSLNKTLPLLTLFTTMKVMKAKFIAYNNTLKNWKKLIPFVPAPIVFSSDSYLIKQCESDGWKALPIRRIAAGGAPVLKDMYKDAMSKFSTLFYAYSNADILFDDSLLQALWLTAKTQDLSKPLLIMGIRTNVLNVMPHEVITWSAMKSTAKRRGKHFLRNAEDYFITSYSYPWNTIPDVVIGRRAYDNWLVLNARKQKHNLIDASDTVLALHQTTKAGNFEGHRHRDGNYNLRLLSRRFGKIHYGAGSTICASLKTSRQADGNITLTRRTKLMNLCFPI
ncbi:Hypothetical predicted protein [Octopus vulgaris]|uniref:Uncharacterized protein n=1 Tax=Octopus vulgaris TaxID=6645 RepID=A0AA36EW59_OCTVU|nr:Hypothetical predicted protein [Octopus vulgaris]